MEKLIKEIVMLCRENMVEDVNRIIPYEGDMREVGQREGAHYASEDILTLIEKYDANLVR